MKVRIKSDGPRRQIDPVGLGWVSAVLAFINQTFVVGNELSF